ncbi:MAG: alkane 1-monooxygenase [Saprospiraceae bacterium]
MKIGDLKYTAAYINPLLLILALMSKNGFLLWLPVIFSFLIIPILELVLTPQTNNLSIQEMEEKKLHPIFDWMLYLNLVVVYLALLLSARYLTVNELNPISYLGLLFSLSLVLASNGINVAHELGHRNNLFEYSLAKFLLMPSLYTHFSIEHNRGHHLNVATPLDPSTARYNEVLYKFWFRSIVKGYQHAWKLENHRLKSKVGMGRYFGNEMILNLIISILYILFIYNVFGLTILLFFLLAAVISVFMLETINYIEHYGLKRQKNQSGRYERVNYMHSWDANYPLGRIVLYELTRHADHHASTFKKYQTLNSQDGLNSLPYGYPTSMILALWPPVWFKIMNKRISENRDYGY